MRLYCQIGVFNKKDGMEYNFGFGDLDQKYCQIYINGRIYNTIDKDQHNTKS